MLLIPKPSTSWLPSYPLCLPGWFFSQQSTDRDLSPGAASRALQDPPAAQHSWMKGSLPSPNTTQPPKDQQNSTASDITIYEHQSMKEWSLYPSCVRQGLWHHHPPLPVPGRQPGPAAPSCCFRQQAPARMENSAVNLPPARASIFPI